MRIAHLSDLHASEQKAADQELLLRKLLEDLKREHAARPIDVLVVSGDLADHGKGPQFALARDALILPALEALQLSTERLIVVPGNHDVDRSCINRFTEKGLRDGLTSRDSVNELLDSPEDLADAARRLDAWGEFRDELFTKHPLTARPPLGFTREIEIENQIVGIALLNSSWRASGGAADRGKLLIGDRQLHATLDSIAHAHTKIAVVHHPLDWLQPHDADPARRAFEDGGFLVLSGHEHNPDPKSEISTRGEAIYSRAGCLYENRDYFNGYSIIDLGPGASEVVVTIRSWWPKREVFDVATDIVHDGRVTLPWAPSHRIVPGTGYSYSTVLDTLATAVQGYSPIADFLWTEDVAKIDDLLVEPRFWRRPYREIVAASRVDAATKPTPADALATLAATPVLVVAGEPDSGVTGSLFWILAQAFEQDGGRAPVHLSYDDHFKDKRFDRALRRELGRLGKPLEREDPLPVALIAVDDVSAGRSGSLDAFCKYVAAHPEHKYILGCHDSDVMLVRDALDKRSVDSDGLYIGPFARQQLRALIKKADVPAESEVLERVANVIMAERLPRSPFIMAALVAVLRSEADLATFNSVAIVDAYVRLLLGNEFVHPDADAFVMDERQREHLLGWFACYMVRRGEYVVTRFETEEAFGLYARERGWGTTFSPGHVLDSLITRRVLIEDERGVSFRHDAFHDLFAGKWMSDDPTFASEVLEKPLDHQGAIRHAAGLRRNDNGLVAAVRDVAAELGDDVAPEVDLGLFDAIKERPGWSQDAPGVDELRRALSQRAIGESDQVEAQLDNEFDEFGYRDETDSPLNIPQRSSAWARRPGYWRTY